MQFQNHYSTLIHVTVTRVKETWDDFKAHWTEKDVKVIIFGDGLLGFCLNDVAQIACICTIIFVAFFEFS